MSDGPSGSTGSSGPIGPTGGGARRAYPVVVLAAISVGGVLLRQAVGPVVRWGDVYDDGNQLRVAAGLLSGQWLGEWGSQPDPSLTLSKGPGYPLFVALIHPLGVGTRIGSYVLLLVGALLLALAVRRLVGWGWALLLYALVAFCPNVMAVSFSRSYRDQLVAALALLAVGCAVWVGLSARQRVRFPSLPLASAAAGLALSLGWLAVTRADTVWVVVTCALIVLVVSLSGAGRWRAVGRLVLPVVVVVAAVVAAPAAVAAANERAYGVGLPDDYSRGGFADTMRWWSAVRAPGGEAYQLVTRQQRAVVYAISPAARAVESRLEDPTNPWVGVGCGARPEGAGPCTEYGAFFGWAVRDAAYAAGYRTARTFQDYFVTLASEISTACRSGTLSCETPPPVPDLPPLSHLSPGVTAVGAVNLVAGSLLYQDNQESPQAPVPSDPTLVALWESVYPDVGELVVRLEEGATSDEIAQAPLVSALRVGYCVLSVLALLVLLAVLFRGALFRSVAGRLSLVLVVGWLLNIGIVAVVFGATNRQFVRVVPSYTLAGQPILVAALVLAVAAVIRSRRRGRAAATGGAPAAPGRRPAG